MDVGRPRSVEITERALTAARAQFQAGGLEGLNYGAIAASAHTSRTAIYRRWPNKIDLALDLIEQAVRPGSMPLTGSLVEDLTQHAMQNAGNQRAVDKVADPQGLWALLLSPEVLTVYMERIGARQRQIGRSIIHQWVDRDALPVNVNADLILDTLAGLTLFHSVVHARSVTEDEVRAVARSLCQNPPRKPKA